MMKKSVSVDRKNLGEYARRISRIELRRKKLLSMRTCAGLTSGAAFFAAALSAAYGIAGSIEMPVFSRLRFLGDAWKTLCAAFLPEGYSPQEAILFSILAAVLIAAAVHLLTALAVGLACSETSPVPMEGSESQQAAALCKRCAAAGTRLPDRKSSVCILISLFYALILLLPTLLDRNEMTAALAETGLVKLIASVSFMIALLALIYGVPYAVFLWVSGLFYRVRRKSQWEDALDAYAKQCKIQEEEQARAEAERKSREEAEQNRREGDALYRRAIANQTVDEELMWQAAELGSRPACLYLGRQMMEAWSTGSFTKEEKADIAEVAKNYFHTASLEEDFKESRIEAQFGYLMFQVLTESGSAAKWQGVLSQLREVRDSGLLPERFHETCIMLVRTVVDLIDASAAQTPAPRRSAEPVVKRCYCKFFNAGACGWRSTDGYTSHCNYVTNPGQCSTALMNHGLGFEFE